MFWKLGKNLLRMKISVVVPVYNSQSSLEELVTRLQSVLPTCSSKFEIILVNDGSTDKSADVIRKLEQLYDFVVPINLMRNYGQHSALLCGIRAARYEVTVTLDDDLQNPPEEIPKLLALLEEGYDVVYGTREKEQHGIFRNLASRITKLTLARTMGVGIADNISSFRAFRTSIRNSFEQYRSSLVMLDVLLTWGATKFAYVKVSHFARLLGQSNYGLRNLFVHALNMITGFTTIHLVRFCLYRIRGDHACVRNRAPLCRRRCASWFRFLVVRDYHLLRCTTNCTGNYWRIPWPNFSQRSGKTALCRKRFTEFV